MRAGEYRRMRVLERKREAKDTESIYFEDPLCSAASPGQFVMVWLPGVDEFPMSLSRIGGVSSMTALRKGKGTEALLTAEDISIRGPFGNGFSSPSAKKVLIAGGIGMASLMPLVTGGDHVFLGARSAEYLPFVDEIAGREAHLHIATDDGSMGFKGNVVDLFVSTRPEGHVYSCGPMGMLKTLHEHRIEAEASLESYMKCAIGICDSCTINGFIVCREGPVVRDLDRIFG